jgi:epsilon-lactone hydrolase
MSQGDPPVLVAGARHVDFVFWADTCLAGADPQDPRASPLFGDLRGLPPMLIQVGGAEMLLDQVSAFAARARAAGVQVAFRREPDMVHDWHALASMFRQGKEAIAEVGRFIRERTEVTAR